MYGLSTNTANLQRQADEGTLLATRSCALGSRRRVPHARVKRFKPGKFLGKLEGLATLSRKCSCPAGF